MPLTQSEIEKVLEDTLPTIEAAGGAGAILDDLKEFRKLHGRLLSQRGSLMKQHPDKWVAMGRDGVVAIGDSEIEALDNLEKLGLNKSDAITEFLDTDPPVLII